EDAPPRPAASGYLKAIDPLTGEEVWSVQRATPYNGGALATAGGLVFQGDAAGQLAAYDADNGSLLWEYDTRGNTPASPITYEIDGEQYLAVLVGRAWRREGSDGRLMVFKLGAEEGEVTPEQIGAADIPEPPPLTVSEEDVGRGEVLYNRTCVGCHGIGAVATINADLRMMSEETHERFQDIVRGGVLADKGMLSFAAAVTAEEAELIRQYVISEALRARAAPAKEGERGSGRD
ncbi:MAG: PQQ-binding-like beta-propeller repeat protein, partial [Gammaproteobacteria bacterium]|nr:PQQ-binding-like beta-propeller repeat protein [Gammaproteobacteria bacterium]